MKVAIVLLALVAAAAAASYGKSNVDWAHAPHYTVNWAVEDDYYNSYAQDETRHGDNTKTYWRVALPGKGSHIKRDDLVDAHARVSHSVGGYSAPAAYGKAAYGKAAYGKAY